MRLQNGKMSKKNAKKQIWKTNITDFTNICYNQSPNLDHTHASLKLEEHARKIASQTFEPSRLVENL